MKRYLMPQARWLVCALFLALTAALAAVAVQFIKGRLLDYAIAGQGSQSLQLMALLLGVILFEITCYYLYNRCRGQYQTRALTCLREDFFSAQLNKTQGLMDDKRQGELLAAYTEQIDTVDKKLLQNFPLLVEIFLKIIIVSTLLFLLDARIALMTLLLSTTPLYVPKLVQKHLERAQKAHTLAFSRHLAQVTEWLSALGMIKNYGAQAPILSRFTASNQQLRSKHLQMLRLGYLSQTVSTCLSYLSHFIILAYAAWLVVEGSFSAGDFFIAVGMIDQMSWPILGITYYLQDMIAARPILNGLIENMAPEPQPHETLVRLSRLNQVSAMELSFAYPGQPPLFSGLHFTVQSGEKVLITGPSGGGKTTLMNLLLASFMPSAGQIDFDHIPARQVANMQELVTIMAQQPMLLEDSLRNNLSLYRDVKDADMIRALMQVNLHEFASPEGLDRLIREGGKNLSGGEKRRICLARSLLRPSPILILDEPLAEIDPESLEMIEDLILCIQDRMLFVISHQVSPRLKAAFSHQIQVGEAQTGD
ncbi:MAG: ABC transporter ATP-binding protein [Clostridiales bacterium]|nr:ABC transporter ATP-binding protein [Clostridiales bacterium]